VASYVSYGVEKLRGSRALSRVAASETSNNSAVVANWLPLLVFGMPITSIEIVFLQHFNQYGFSIQSLSKTEAILVVMVLCLLSAVCYFLIALKTNRAFYIGLSRFITNPLFSMLVILLSLFTYATMNNFGWDIVFVHLLVFVPLGWLFYKLGTSMLVITVALLLSNQIFFTFMQLYQIYF
jgi:TctA family transporter